jgi:hypothetical protein
MRSDVFSLIAFSVFHISSVYAENCWSKAFKCHSRSARRAIDYCFAPSLLSICHPLLSRKECAWIRYYHTAHAHSFGYIMHTRSRIRTPQSKNDHETKPAHSQLTSRDTSAGEIQWPIRKNRATKKESKTITELNAETQVDPAPISPPYAVIQTCIPEALKGGGASVSEGIADQGQDLLSENRQTKRKRSVTAFSPAIPATSIDSIEVKPAANRKSRKSTPAEQDVQSIDMSKSVPSSTGMEGKDIEASPAKATKARAKAIEPGSLPPPAGHRPTSSNAPREFNC